MIEEVNNDFRYIRKFKTKCHYGSCGQISVAKYKPFKDVYTYVAGKEKVDPSEPDLMSENMVDLAVVISKLNTDNH